MHKSCYTVYMESLIQNEEYYSYPIIRTYSYIPVSNLRHEYCKCTCIYTYTFMLPCYAKQFSLTFGSTDPIRYLDQVPVMVCCHDQLPFNSKTTFV